MVYRDVYRRLKTNLINDLTFLVKSDNLKKSEKYQIVKDSAKMPDFTYTESNGYIILSPENQQAVEAWNVMSNFTFGTGKLLKSDLANVKAQLRKAGYTVKKAIVIDDDLSDDELLAMLG